jgi:hypothetical protein
VMCDIIDTTTPPPPPPLPTSAIVARAPPVQWFAPLLTWPSSLPLVQAPAQFLPFSVGQQLRQVRLLREARLLRMVSTVPCNGYGGKIFRSRTVLTEDGGA